MLLNGVFANTGLVVAHSGDQARVHLEPVFSIYHIAAMQIQYMWRSFHRNRYIGMSDLSPQEKAVVKIQHLWRRYTNRRIYFYYRNLIKFRNAGDPALMLRCINPREAALFDQASGVHVRFRLGGALFPQQFCIKFLPISRFATLMRSPHVTTLRPGKTEEAKTTMIQAIHLLEIVEAGVVVRSVATDPIVMVDKKWNLMVFV